MKVKDENRNQNYVNVDLSNKKKNRLKNLSYNYKI